MGLPWEKRGVRMDETIDIVRGLTAGGWFEYDGDVWKLDRCKITPVPAQADPDPRRRPLRAGAAPRRATGRRLDPRGR